MTSENTQTNKSSGRDTEVTTRRTLLAGAGAVMIGWEAAPTLAELVISEARAAVPASGKDEIAVTLLGTGTPSPDPDRFGPATLVEAGGLTLLFDSGRGATVRLNQLNIPFGRSLDAVFLTHYHSDHVNGLPDIWMVGFLPVPFAGRVKPMRLWGPTGKLYGPTGVSRIAKNLTEAFSDDIRIRMVDEHVPEAATQIEAHDFDGDGVVFDEGGVKVAAFEVNHGPLIKPACGYRVDYAGRSVTISGDTKFDENVIRYGTGVDLLIHEVCAMPAALLADNPVAKRIMDHHTSPEDAGIVFSRAKPKLAAFTHIVLVPPLSLDELAARTRSNYQGPLVLGEDLMRFTVGNTVTVHKWDLQRKGYPD